MTCREAEKWMTRSEDGTLDPGRRQALDGHLETCARCRAFQRTLGLVRNSLRAPAAPEPLPYFWQRLQSRIAEREKAEAAAVWLKWSLRAIPVSLVVIGFFIGAIAFLSPALETEMSQTEALLLRNDNPLAETKTLFDEDKIEAKNLMIIFASNETASSRRYMP